MSKQNKHYDAIVVGAGITGSVIAEQLAGLNKKVVVVEKRNHIGGNCYDFINENDILVPRYGPHFFHTNYDDVWEYVSKFTDWRPYEHRVLSNVGGILVPVPVNIETVNKLFNLKIDTEKKMCLWLEKNTIPNKDPKNSEEVALSRVGIVLYEKLFKNYTKKQWDMWPKELDPSVMSRIPIRTNHDDRYFTDKYQAMPKNGYTAMFRKMLSHPNIDIVLNTDYAEFIHGQHHYGTVLYTGRIDDYFTKLGLERLQYRSLRFEYETLDVEFYQPCAQVNYPNEKEYTRITEPKHATGQKHIKTTVIKEYPTWEGEAFYPVPTKRNKTLYMEYRKKADSTSVDKVYFIGRLAEYKYINMDQAFKNALDFCKNLIL